ncbi:uncharacterized protein TNCV_2242151 [Trichonephila clavipes]|nr:uncharacterized protein TNCV_2242151 [Trichonephila clavipes]
MVLHLGGKFLSFLAWLRAKRLLSDWMLGLILSMDKLNLDQAPQDINKEEFQLDCVRLQAFLAVTDPGCKKELIRSGFLGLLKYIIESKLEDG